MLGVASNLQNQGQCRICQGNGSVFQKNGAVQVCPLCDGTGRWEPPYNRVPMTYVLGNAAQIVLVASTGPGVLGPVFSNTLYITGDYDFELWQMVATMTGIFADQISDQTYAWQPQNTPINNPNRWGTIQFPFIHAPRIILPKKHVITGLFQDMSGATNTIQPCFVGYDLHPIIEGRPS